MCAGAAPPDVVLGQIHDVAERSLHNIVAAQIFVDRLCLCRRLYDHERFAHHCPFQLHSPRTLTCCLSAAEPEVRPIDLMPAKLPRSEEQRSPAPCARGWTPGEQHVSDRAQLQAPPSHRSQIPLAGKLPDTARQLQFKSAAKISGDSKRPSSRSISSSSCRLSSCRRCSSTTRSGSLARRRSEIGMPKCGWRIHHQHPAAPPAQAEPGSGRSSQTSSQVAVSFAPCLISVLGPHAFLFVTLPGTA